MKDIIEEMTGEILKPFDEPDWHNGEYHWVDCFTKDGELRFVIEVCDGNVIIGVDRVKVFNKFSQCPIFFGFTLEDKRIPKRRKKAIVRAIAHLKTDEGTEQSATFDFPFFGDDLTREYYRQK